MEKRYKRYTSAFQDNRENSDNRKNFEHDVMTEFIQMLSNEQNLNVKVDKQLFDELVDDIGFSLQNFSRKVANNPNDYSDINKILDSNPVPQVASQIMTKEFRVFCLSLNALKQFISAEQASMDRVLLGGKYKGKIKKVIKTCIVTKELLHYDKKGQVNFHHTMRDGRFPIPLTKQGHDMIEGQLKIK